MMIHNSFRKHTVIALENCGLCNDMTALQYVLLRSQVNTTNAFSLDSIRDSAQFLRLNHNHWPQITKLLCLSVFSRPFPVPSMLKLLVNVRIWERSPVLNGYSNRRLERNEKIVFPVTNFHFRYGCITSYISGAVIPLYPPGNPRRRHVSCLLTPIGNPPGFSSPFLGSGKAIRSDRKSPR